ncbi:nuclear transport factor 2 family protein [Geodermatophilus sp. SYSU D00758]
MSEHPNVQRIRDAYEAFAKGDLAAMPQYWADDIRWHSPGRNAVAGTYEGASQVFELFGRLVELTGGTLRVEPQAVFADDTHAVALVHLTGHRDGRTLDLLDAHVMRMADGRVTEFWAAPTDPVAMDEFWA